jgi:hypothetical protein
VPVSASCEATECPPGTALQAIAPPNFDSGTCTASVDCACVELPPLTAGSIGRHLTADADRGNLSFLAAYNSTYGDLMFGQAGADGVISWEYLLGVPETGTISGSINGPRGGRAAAGPDAGLWPSLRVGIDGQILLAFHWRSGAPDDASGLWMGVGTPADGKVEWSFFPVYTEVPSAGQWTELLLDASGLPLLVFGVPGVRDGESRTWSDEVWMVRADTPRPTASSDFRDPVLLDRVLRTTPCANACPDRTVCRLDVQDCQPTQRAAACDPACGAGQACFAGEDGGPRTCADVFEAPALTFFAPSAGQFLAATLSDDGRLWVASYDGQDTDLRLVTHTLGTEDFAVRVLDGSRLEEGARVDTGNVGLHPDIHVSATGDLTVVYYDADRGRLLVYEQAASEEQGTVSVLDDGFRCFTRDGANCTRSLVARVGGDPCLVVSESGQLSVAFQDGTQHDVVLIQRRESGWDGTFRTLLEGADGFGFYTAMAQDRTGLLFATQRIRVPGEDTPRDVVIVRP